MELHHRSAPGAVELTAIIAFSTDCDAVAAGTARGVVLAGAAVAEEALPAADCVACVATLCSNAMGRELVVQ